MKINRFEEMEVWQLAREIVKDIYILTNKNKFNKDYALTKQMQRAGISIMSNIAEGYERKTNKEFIQLLFIAKGSCGELRSQLYIALDLGYIEKEEFEKTNSKLETISKSLSGFIKYLSSKDK